MLPLSLGRAASSAAWRRCEKLAAAARAAMPPVSLRRAERRERVSFMGASLHRQWGQAQQIFCGGQHSAGSPWYGGGREGERWGNGGRTEVERRGNGQYPEDATLKCIFLTTCLPLFLAQMTSPLNSPLAPRTE